MLGESGILGDFKFLFLTVALHFSEEGFDDLGNEEVETGKDEGNYEADDNLLFVGEEQVFEEGMGGIFGAEESSDGFEHFEAWFREGKFQMR